jgi:hypothetical protein
MGDSSEEDMSMGDPGVYLGGAEEEESTGSYQEYMKKKMENEEEELLATMNATTMYLEFMDEEEKIDGRTLPRNPRREFDHDRAYNAIMKDFLGPEPMFTEKEFISIYRISIARFNRIKKDVLEAKIPYYCKIVEVTGRKGPSLEARLLLPLRVLAYGVAAYAFFDYFQISKAMCRVALAEFDQMMKQLYQAEYLRIPTAEDLINISRLHKEAHKFDGMFGSLDCMHVVWNKCPVAWQGSFKGAKGKPTVVLEAIADYHLWFWHAAFGYCGSMNDKTILDLSPFLKSLVDGSFIAKEKEAKTVPFTIGEKECQLMYVLVDGIYPEYCRFVRGIKEPTDRGEKKFAGWQESARKDIERAFGVLQGKFQYLARPVEEHDLYKIAQRVATCLILHNMCVSDRVMQGDVYARYNPTGATEADDSYDIPEDRETIQRSAKLVDAEDGTRIRHDKEPYEIIQAITRREAWRVLKDEKEYAELHKAFIATFEKSNKARKDT